MSDLKYLKRKETLFKYCYLAVKEHFESEDHFNKWFEGIGSDQKKNTFLKVASYYLALLLGLNWGFARDWCRIQVQFAISCLIIMDTLHPPACNGLFLCRCRAGDDHR
jgi:hypothetical protein